MGVTRDKINALLEPYDKNPEYQCSICGETLRNAKLGDKMVRMDSEGRDHTPICQKRYFEWMWSRRKPKKPKPPKKYRKVIPPPHSKKMDMVRRRVNANTYFQLGLRAAILGKTPEDNPYMSSHPLANVKHHLWKRGFETYVKGPTHIAVPYRVAEIRRDLYPPVEQEEFKRSQIKRETWFCDSLQRYGGKYADNAIPINKRAPIAAAQVARIKRIHQGDDEGT